MSWSIRLAGKKSDLLAKIDEEFDRNKCGDNFPIEQAIKNQFRDMAKQAVACASESDALIIEASGSASSTYDPDTKTYTESSQACSFKVEKIWGFIG